MTVAEIKIVEGEVTKELLNNNYMKFEEYRDHDRWRPKENEKKTKFCDYAPLTNGSKKEKIW